MDTSLVWWSPPCSFGPAAVAKAATPGMRWLRDALRLPFDLLRMQRAEAVQAGLIANSMLASRDFERAVDALEHIALGPLARNV